MAETNLQLAKRLSDFPERLSPMLVKELRQGLRARSFVVLFLVLQGLLGLILLSAVSADTSGGVGGSVSGIIFFFVSVALLVFQPLRGVSALAGEIKANTMEIMVLTRLSAWRITLGKWSAIVSQSALIVAAIIPYLILRYFLGGMQLFAELLILAVIFIVSGMLTAIAVGLSANRHLVLRAIFPLALVPMGLWTIGMILFASSRGLSSLADFFSLATPESRAAIGSIVFFAIYLGWLALDMGASLIAPISENRATPRRCVLLALLVPGLWLVGHPAIEEEVQAVLIGLLLAPFIIITLAEPVHATEPMVASFTRRGLVGRLAALFLYPGWAAGAIFSTAVAGAAIGVHLLRHGAAGSMHAYGFGHTTLSPMLATSYHEEVVTICSTFGSLIFPAVLLVIFGKRITHRFSAYLLLLLSSGILLGLVSLIAEAMDQERLLYLFIWLPSAALPLAEMNYADRPMVGALAGLVCALYTLVLLLAALRVMARVLSGKHVDLPAAP